MFLVMLCSKMIMPDKNCYEANASSGTYRYVKRSIDIIGSLLVLIAFSPVFLILLVLIKSKDGGPAFFAQERIGKNGRLFKMYKFLSMKMDFY